MIEVKKPMLLDSSLNEVEILHPRKASASIRMCGVSEWSLTLPNDAPAIGMHSWVKLYNQNGFAGIYRMTSSDRDVMTDKTYVLKHGIDILHDSHWEAETDFSGTRTEFLTAVLNQQKNLIGGVKPWVLGTCDDTATMTKKINYDNCLDLLQWLEDEGGDYVFTYDQSSFPWTVNFVSKSSTVACEFRLKRNMEKCQISINDSKLCTRLLLEVNAMMPDEDLDDVDQNERIVRTYDNATSQATYGIITKHEDIDTKDTLPSGPFTEADAYAQKYLNERADPVLTVRIDGYELSKYTGDSWDEAQIGTLCRVAVPDYATFISERLTQVNYPDVFGLPGKVTVTLSNATSKYLRDQEDLSSTMESQQAEVRRLGGGGRGRAREIESFDQHFQITDKNNNILKQAGLHLDAQGMLVYADDNVNMIGSRFNVQADKISMVVGTNQQGNYIKAGEITLAINATTGQSTALIDANHVNISGTNTVQTIAGAMERDTNGDLIIKEGVGFKLRKATSGGGTAEYGVWDEGNLTAGIVVGMINGQQGTFVKISADKIELDGTTIAGKLSGQQIVCNNIHTTTGQNTIEGATGFPDAVTFGGDVTYGNYVFDWKSKLIRTVGLSTEHKWEYTKTDGTTATLEGRIVTSYTDSTIYYLGHT